MKYLHVLDFWAFSRQYQFSGHNVAAFAFWELAWDSTMIERVSGFQMVHPTKFNYDVITCNLRKKWFFTLMIMTFWHVAFEELILQTSLRTATMLSIIRWSVFVPKSFPNYSNFTCKRDFSILHVSQELGFSPVVLPHSTFGPRVIVTFLTTIWSPIRIRIS